MIRLVPAADFVRSRAQPCLEHPSIQVRSQTLSSSLQVSTPLGSATRFSTRWSTRYRELRRASFLTRKLFPISINLVLSVTIPSVLA